MPRLDHVHDWEHLGGAAFGMYRCKVCLCFGYSRLYRGPQVYRNTIVPYRCAKCGARATGHDKIPPARWKNNPYRTRKEWRCARHRSRI